MNQFLTGGEEDGVATFWTPNNYREWNAKNETGIWQPKKRNQKNKKNQKNKN